VAAFYAYWSSFNSKLSFAWEDRYNPNDAPNRDVRRAIDKENKKFRDAARKTYVDTVRALCDYVKKRDKRMIAWAALAQAERKRKDDEQERKKAENAARKREERRTRQEEVENDEEERLRRVSERQRAFLLADESSDESSTGNETNDEIESYAGQGVGRAYSNEELVDAEISTGGKVEDSAEDVLMFLCEICRKSFKSEPQLNAHLSSKNHRKAEQEAKKAAMKGNSKKTSQSVSVVVDKIAADLSHVEVGGKEVSIKKDKQGKKEKSRVQSNESGLGDDEDDSLPASAQSVFTLRGRSTKSVPAERIEDELFCCRGCGESFDSRNSCKNDE
jgi:DnaJ homolog subfamily A member 5